MDVDYGYELDRFSQRGLVVRWWLYVALEDAEGRPQRPRLGVAGRGFRFARGGRTCTAGEAEAAIRSAYRDARAELEFWRGQPSHALGAGGELIPLGELLPELPSPCL